MIRLKISRNFLICFFSCFFLLLISTINVYAKDVDSNGKPINNGVTVKKKALLKTLNPSVTSSLGQTVQNPDGSFTFTQTVNANSGAPYYTPPSNGGGFGIYSEYDQDYGWMHDFPAWDKSGITIKSAQIKIVAWDVDSEVFNGWDGEYDGLSVDGVALNPGYLQGQNDQWSTTTFDIPVNSILDDGKINMWLDIDMHHQEPWWLTTLDYSELTITYTINNQGNNAPFKPQLSPGSNLSDNSDIVVNVIGPNPADPDNDSVKYQYRWFVDVGTTGSFIDDEFAGRGKHTGNTVPASDTQPGDRWQVQVTPIDEHGAIGPYATTTWDVVNDAPPSLGFHIFNISGNKIPFNGPTDSAVDSSGNLYVTDYYNNRVVEFSNNGQFIHAYGTVGKGNGQFNKPTGIVIDNNNNVYVADTYNNRIVRFKDFNDDGNIDEWQVFDGTETGTLFNKPMGVWVKDNKLYVTDSYNSRIAVLNELTYTWSTFGNKGKAAGQFQYPYDLTVDSKGNIWVSDTFNNRVQEFDQGFKYIKEYSTNLPYGIAVSKYDNIFVAERLNGDIKCVNSSSPVSYGGKGNVAGSFKSPLGVNIDSNGQMWVIDVTTGIIQYANIPIIFQVGFALHP